MIEIAHFTRMWNYDSVTMRILIPVQNALLVALPFLSLMWNRRFALCGVRRCRIVLSTLLEAGSDLA